MPREASTGPVETFVARLSEHWASMDGSHFSSNPTLHRHIVSLDWYRTELQFAYRLGPGWDAELDVPYDVKDEDVRYELPDGSSYASPTGPLHHRTETLEGFADLRLWANYRPTALLHERDSLHLGLGLSLPTGRTEENPYELAALGIPHQHIQFGTGTVDPLARVDYSIAFGAWQFGVSFGLHAPLYKNSKDYRGATNVEASIGPSVRIAEWLSLSVRYAPLYQTRAYWDGDQDENSGYFLQAIAISAPIRISPTVTLLPTALRPFSVDVRSGGDNFEMEWMFGIGVQVDWGAPAATPAGVPGKSE